MRWRFPEYLNSRELEERRSILHRIDRWWAEFKLKAPEIDAHFQRRSKWDLAAWMEKTLSAIHPALMWEYGPAVQGEGHRLVITPEGDRHLRPLADHVVACAPKLAGWEFYGHRLGEGEDWVVATVAGREKVDITGSRVRLAAGESGLVDFTIVGGWVAKVDEHKARQVAFVAAESLVGEATLDRWIGVIDVEAPRGSGTFFGKLFAGSGALADDSTLALSEVKAAVEERVRAYRETLPAATHAQRTEGAEWSTYTLKPQPAPDFARRDDMFVAVTMNPPLCQEMLSRRPVWPERFSRAGEHFAYLKTDGAQGLGDGPYQDRTSLEDGLDEALRAASAGCTIGGGTGLRYSYVDLALTDLDRGVAAVHALIVKARLPRRTWLLFHDPDLCGEWVSHLPDSPPPPMPEDG